MYKPMIYIVIDLWNSLKVAGVFTSLSAAEDFCEDSKQFVIQTHELRN